MNGAPDRWTNRALRGCAAWQRIDLIQARHIFNRNFHAQVETLRLPRPHHVDRRVDGSNARRAFELAEWLLRNRGMASDGRLTRSLRPTQKTRHFFQRPL